MYLGLSDWIPSFLKERIDLDALMLLTESDLGNVIKDSLEALFLLGNVIKDSLEASFLLLWSDLDGPT